MPSARFTPPSRSKLGAKSPASRKFKITSGTFRGRSLLSPASSATHPMGSRERLALFNAIGPNLKDKVVLDAFAGTGALGLEALSRGARHATFIEKNHQAAEVIRKNIKELGCAERARVFECDVKNIAFDRPYDIVIADPPYELFRPARFGRTRDDELVELLNRLARISRGLFILSHAPEFDPHALDATLLATRNYAGARISTFTESPIRDIINKS